MLVNLYRLAAESISTATWRKSRYSDGGDNNCLEVADNCPGVVPVRDSTRSDSAMLVFRSGSWASFVTHVKKQLSGPPASLAVSCFHGLPPGHAGGQAALLAVFGPLLR
ncbi:DUF397 domain-containing protein [Streptomyces violaceus]|uniref:DUF397 domain-containing protein n=1 Tax=Streptomyces violaceus TaxID=1936 RepID=UPI002E2A293D|nr:DUF397 domain-containing protein [Streptomyces violaceus]